MGTISCTSEIVEAMDLRLKMDDYVGKRRMLKSGQICSIEDDINKLFEAIDIRTSRRSSGLLQQVGKDNLGKRAMKKPMRPGLSQASGIGISEPVNLKQALRGLCISQASEMAAMKRLSKPAGLSRASEAGTIKRLHRAVVVETSKSGLPHNEGNGNLVEISLVPEGNTSNISEKVYESVQLPKVERLNHGAQSSTLLRDTPTLKVKVAKTGPDDVIVPLPTDGEYEISMAELGQNEKSTLTYSTSSVNASEKLPALDEISPASAEVPIKLVEPDKVQKRKLHFASSLSGSRRISVFGNKIKSKVKKDADSVPSSSNQCHGAVDNDLVCKETIGALKCRSKQKEKSSPTSCTTNVSSEVSSHAKDSDFAKPISNSSLSSRTGSIVSKADETSRSREKGEFTQSSKSSIGEYSSSTSISEESILSGSSRSGYRPHMSKDLRWEGIHHVQKQHVSLGLRHFKLLKKVGSGDIGSVYLSELTGTSCLFALKIIDIKFLATKKKAHRAQTEREVLQMLDHPFLPTLYAHFTTDKYSCLVMEYCPGGDLHVLRQKQLSRSFSEQAARFYVAEVLLALEYLHMLGVVYRDLKPENVLVREDGHIMLSDFDLSLRCAVNPMLLKSSPTVESSQGETTPCAESICIHPLCLQPSWEVPCFTPRLISSAGKTRKLRADLSALVSPLPQLVAEPTSARSNSFVGTHEYLAPEIIKGEGHGSAVDWWTFGIFLYELLYGGTPFKGSRNEDTLSNVVSHSLHFPKNPIVTSHARDLIRGLLEKEPVNRLGSVKGAAEIKQHPFFEGLNWALIRCAVPPELPMIFDFGYDIADTSPQDKESSTRSREEFKSTGEHLEFNMF